MRAISEGKFWRTYKPIPSGDEGFMFEHRDTLNFPRERVWSIIDGDDDTLYASPGYHVVNVIGYVITEHPWEDPDLDAVYFGRN